MYGVLSEGFYFFAVDVVHSRTSYIRAVAAATRREYAVFGRHVVIARRIIIIIYHIFILLLLLLRVHNNNIMYIYYIRRRHYYYDVLRAAPMFLSPKGRVARILTTYCRAGRDRVLVDNTARTHTRMYFYRVRSRRSTPAQQQTSVYQFADRFRFRIT